MAKRTGLSESTIGRIWKHFGLQPHRTDGFKLSTDPLSVEKVVDVVGLYHNPPEKAVVLCVDEKSQIQGPPRRSATPSSDIFSEFQAGDISLNLGLSRLRQRTPTTHKAAPTPRDVGAALPDRYLRRREPPPSETGEDQRAPKSSRAPSARTRRGPFPFSALSA